MPVLLNSNLRDGSLREAAVASGTKILLYEAGQALRFDEVSIRAGLRGILRIMGKLGLIKARKSTRLIEPYIAYNSAWVRANESGIVRDMKYIGDLVKKGDTLAEIGSPFGTVVDWVQANRDGIIIGKQNIPLVQEGDAMFHIAYFRENDEDVAEHIENLNESLLPPEIPSGEIGQ